ncbi:MAG: FkbM family methyltransferase [Acidobacteriota bacterium]|nr:FkbM family methyltransferase [Acidobacteriota bacterium]
MTPFSLLRRFRRVAAFVGVSRSPLQWLPLALLGWARDNPSSTVGRWLPTIRVRPAQLRGQAVTVSATDLGQLMSFEEVFVESVYDLGRVPFTPAVVFDCGGHVGFFSVLARSTYPRVPLIVFEPNPENLGPLRRNLSTGSQVAIHAAAVSTRNGTCRFSATASNAGRTGESDVAGIEVAMLDFAAFVSGDPGAALLIKIDIEGEEGRLVPHLLPVLPRQCALFVETHHGMASREALVDQLASYGFEVSWLRVREPYADLFAVRGLA